MTARERYAAVMGRQPKEHPTCDCGCAKRTHRRGWGDCKKKGCACQRYTRNEAQHAQRCARYDAWLTEYHEVAREMNGAAALEQAKRDAPKPTARTETNSAPVGIDVHRFASFAAFTRAAMTPPLNPYNRTAWDEDFASATSSRGGKRFGTWGLGEDCKAKNLAEACAWLSAGWPQGLTRMREALGRLKVPRLADVRRRGKWSDVGDVLSHDRLYSGNVERCWRTTHKTHAGAPPRLQIIVHGSVLGHVSTEELFWRGAPATALCEAAVTAGYTVAVDVMRCARSYTEGGATYMAMTRVKAYDAPTNLPAIIAATAHPAAHRVVTFAHRCVSALDKVDRLGMGNSTEPDLAEMNARGFLDIGSITLVVPMTTFSQVAAKAWLDKQITYLETLGKKAA